MLRDNALRISEVMAGWDNRLRTQQSLLWAPRGLAIGLVVGLIVALAARLFPLFDRPVLLIISGAAALVGFVVSLLGVWVWPRRPLAMARRFDRTFELQERMSTAVELAEGRLPVQSAHLARSQLFDALEVADDVKPADGLPLRLQGRELLLLGVLLAVLGAALLLPNPQTAVLKERQAIAETVEEELERLEELREEIQNDEALSEEEREALVETLTESIESLDQRGMTREEAVAELAAAEQQLREIAAESDEQARLNEEALRAAGESFSTPDLSQQLGQQLSAGDFEGAAEALDNLLDPEGDPLTPEELEALQQELSEAAEQVEETNPELAESLQQAADAVGQNDGAAAQQALSQASQQLSQSSESISQSQASSQAAQQAASQAQQAQQSVAQAGQSQQQGQGQPGGQAQQAGQGQQQGTGAQQSGQGQGQGQPGQTASGGAGTGEGTGQAEGNPISGQMPSNNDPERDEEREFEPIFSPSNLGGEGGADVGLPGQGDPSRDPVAEGDFVENPAGEAQVPYSEVYADYADAANEALEGEYVPLGLRGLIRDYFSSLDPDS
jgi:hypothetical protein